MTPINLHACDTLRHTVHHTVHHTAISPIRRSTLYGEGAAFRNNQQVPYNWTTPDQPGTAQERVLHLWPHQSLQPRGFVWFIGLTFAFILLPLMAVLGSVALWALLPFLLLALAAMWLALARSRRDAQVSEVLTLTQDHAHLIRRTPNGPDQEWDCNRYWARPDIHPRGGPVPHYVTLTGAGRVVEIGAFLSEQERVALYGELVSALRC